MLLINFLRKASVICSRIEPRTYLTFFFLFSFGLMHASAPTLEFDHYPDKAMEFTFWREVFRTMQWLLILIIVILIFVIALPGRFNHKLIPLKLQLTEVRAIQQNQKQQLFLMLRMNKRLKRDAVYLSNSFLALKQNNSIVASGMESRITSLLETADDMVNKTDFINKYIT